MSEEKRIVYLCSTPLHLMNCIIAQTTVNAGIPADIVYEEAADFSELSRRLMAYPVFEECFFYEASLGKAKLNTITNKEERAASIHRPSAVYPFPALTKRYTDICTYLDSYAVRFFYYGLLEMGMTPKVNFVSEGTSSYSMTFNNTHRDGLDHDFYGDRAFLKNIGDLYCFRTELYTGGSDLIRPVRMPNFKELPENVKQIITGVFGSADPVKEKLIFFEGTFWGDGMLTNEMHLFLTIADKIGRENLIVKRHPRNTVDRFTPLGFKVMGKQSVPWEVMIKDIDLSQKVLVSVASFSSFSALEMYGRPSQSLLLKDLMRGRVYFLEDPGYRRFFSQAETIYNSERVTSWSPKTMRELELTLDALEEKVGGWKA